MNSFKNLMMVPLSNAQLDSIITTVNSVISAALGILTAGAIILSIVIAVKFFTADTDDKRKNAKQQLIYAIIGTIVCLALLIIIPTVVQAIKTQAGSAMFGLNF